MGDRETASDTIDDIWSEYYHRGLDYDAIKALLDNFYNEDMHYESGRILGSMYTVPPSVVREAFFKFYQANLGNPGLYPGTRKMERKVVEFLMGLTHGKDNYYGRVVSGGTEANIIAIWAAREMGYKKIYTTEDVHFSVIKAAHLLRMPVEYVPMKEYVMDPDALNETLVDDSIVVATAGTTPLGYVDPIDKIGEVCKDYRCYLHVDAAFGGFVLPFLKKKINFGFEVPEVKSITIDPHKMGMAPYPAGGIVSRENIFSSIAVDAPYLIEGYSDTLLGTRQSGSVAASYAAILYFGAEGYRKIVENCMENTYYLANRAEEEGFEILTRPLLNIVNIIVDNPNRVKLALLNMGWAVSTNPKYSSIRIVVMPHVKKGVIEEFLKDMKKIDTHFL